MPPIRNTDDWQKIEELVTRAIALDPPRRQKFLLSIEDESVRSEVESLLRNDDGGQLELTHAFAQAACAVLKAEEPELEGTRLGRFELLRRIGAGATSEVFLARDSQLGRKVALKLLSRRFTDPALARRFEREAVAASALNHPNILTIYDAGEHDGQVFLATEYVDGESLRSRLGRGPLPMPEALSLAEQLASALSAAHQHGILHRDISPNNVMIRSDGLLKLLDFGLARMDLEPAGMDVSGGTIEGTILGTPSYMSPEQARGRRVDQRSDLWGLGAVLYEMLTGEVAFSGDSVPDILVSILEREPRRLSTGDSLIPPAVDDLVQKLLAKDPAARPTSVADVAQQLRSIQGMRTDVPVRRPGRTRVMTAGAVVIVAAIAIVLWRVGRTDALPELVLHQLTTTVAENRVTAAAVSHDGRSLAFASLDGTVVIRDVHSSAVRVMPAPPDTVIDDLSWLGPGAKLVASVESRSPHFRSLWLLDFDARLSRTLRDDARSGTASPDGQRVVFTNANASEIWIARSDGTEARPLIIGGNRETFPLLVWSPDNDRIYYQRRYFAPEPGSPVSGVEEEKNYRRNIAAVDLSGTLLAEAPVPMTSACVLRGGRMLFVQEEPRGFDWNLWDLPLGSGKAMFAGEPSRLTNVRDRYLAKLTCSLDGSFRAALVPVSQSDVYAAEMIGSSLQRVRRVTMEDRSEYPHAWTQDSEAIIFEQMGKDNWDLYTQRLDQRVARPLSTAPETEIMAQATPDGKWVLFSAYDDAGENARAKQKLMRIALEGGEAYQVPVGAYDEFRCALRTGGRCVLRTLENRQYIYSELDPVTGRGKELARTAWSPGLLGDWALSADGLEAAIPNHDPREARIVLISLADPGESVARTKELIVPGLANLRGLTPSARNDGWFASVTFSRGVRLVHIDRKGRFKVLRESPVVTWGVPSPDGRFLAFVDQTLLSNVWSISHR